MLMGKNRSKINGGYWDSVVAEWKKSEPHKLWRAYCERLNAMLLKSWLPTGKVERLLKTDLFDEAVGEGLHPLLVSRARTFIGMDLSFLVLHTARSLHSDLLVISADACDLPFADGVFDIVVSNSTLDHFASPDRIEASLRELRRVLRTGGQLLLTLDNLANPLIALRSVLPFSLMKRLGIVPYYVGATVGPGGLCRVLRRVGLEVRQLHAMMHCPRVFAVAFARVLAKWASPQVQMRFLRLLLAFERLSCWPTRFITAYFVAVRAVKR
jgi:SAM-dependent methyltransferase